MVVDIHTHTTISSGCSMLEPESLIEVARRQGLDGVCVTDHYFIQGADVTQQLGREMGFPVFRGVEARTDLGDMLVFNYYRDIAEGISFEELCWSVHELGGLVFAAHPFHTSGGPSLAQRLQDRGHDLSQGLERVQVLRELDGVETLNGQVSPQANAEAEMLARHLGVPGIGGSDAHAAGMVGRAATTFSRPIHSDEDLVAALKSDDYSPVWLRA